MNNRAGRIALIVVGVIAVLVGAVWVGQGAGLIPGSVMTGSVFWLWVGIIVAVVGVVLLVTAFRRPKNGTQV